MQCAAVGSNVVVSNRGFGIGPLRSLRSKRGLVVVAGDPKDDPFHDPAVCPTEINNKRSLYCQIQETALQFWAILAFWAVKANVFNF